MPYSTTKAAQLHMTRLVALDEGAHNIRCNAVCPGPILTEATSRHAAGVGRTLNEVVADMTSCLAIRRMGTCAEVANAVLFLASPESSFTTRAVLQVDGGCTLS